MKDVKTMDLLKAFYEANGYLFDVVDVISEQLTNVVAYGEETFDYYQEDGAFLALLADVKASIKELSTLPGGVSNNNSGNVRNEIKNFVFHFENRIEVWETTYPKWHKLFKDANRELYASAQISTPYDFLRMIIS